MQEYLYFLDDVGVRDRPHEKRPFVDVAGFIVFVWMTRAETVRVSDVER